MATPSYHHHAKIYRRDGGVSHSLLAKGALAIQIRFIVQPGYPLGHTSQAQSPTDGLSMELFSDDHPGTQQMTWDQTSLSIISLIWEDSLTTTVLISWSSIIRRIWVVTLLLRYPHPLHHQPPPLWKWLFLLLPGETFQKSDLTPHSRSISLLHDHRPLDTQQSPPTSAIREERPSPKLRQIGVFERTSRPRMMYIDAVSLPPLLHKTDGENTFSRQSSMNNLRNTMRWRTRD